MLELKDKFQLIIEALGIRKTEMADELRLTKASISDILYGRVQNLSGPVIELLKVKFNINPTWLLTGEGEMFLISKTDKKKDTVSSGYLTVHDGDAEIFPVDEDNIHHTVWWEHLSAPKRFIAAGLPELSDEDAEKLRYAVEVMVLAERKRKEDEEKEKNRVRQKGETGAG